MSEKLARLFHETYERLALLRVSSAALAGEGEK